MLTKFAFSTSKALEALAYIASVRLGFTAPFVSKLLFFAEKWHINRYGRPIIADNFIAMVHGPVPSTVKDFIDEKWDWIERPDGFDEAIAITLDRSVRRLMPGLRGPDMTHLSATDVECLRDAIAFCDNKTADELSEITHFEKSWQNAKINSAMDYEDFVDDSNINKEEILRELREFAACGVL